MKILGQQRPVRALVMTPGHGRLAPSGDSGASTGGQANSTASMDGDPWGDGGRAVDRIPKGYGLAGDGDGQSRDIAVDGGLQ